MCSCVYARKLAQIFQLQRATLFSLREGMMHESRGVHNSRTLVLWDGARETGPSLYLFTVVRRTCAYTRQSGITSSSNRAGFPPKAIRARTCRNIHSAAIVGGNEPRRKKKRGQTRPRLRPAKWINDRRTREKRIVDRTTRRCSLHRALVSR